VFQNGKEKVCQEMDSWVAQTAGRSPAAGQAVTPPRPACEPCGLVLAVAVLQPMQLETTPLHS